MNKIVGFPVEGVEEVESLSIAPAKPRQKKTKRKVVSELSKVKKIGLELVPSHKIKRKKASQGDYAKITWKPWTGKKPDSKPFLDNERLQEMIGIPCRLAYAYMFKTREEQIAQHGTADPKILDKLMAMWSQAEEDLKSLVQLLSGASGRMLASACAFVEREDQAKGRKRKTA